MTDDHHRMGIFSEVNFEPGCALEIKIVGRFIQKKKVRLRKQNPAQGGPHAPSARELPARPRKVGLGKSKADQYLRGPRFRRIRVDICEAGVDLANPHRILGGLGFLHEGRALHIGRQHHIEKCLIRGRDLLGHKSHAGPSIDADRSVPPPLPFREILPDQTQERRLSCAVTPHKAHFPTVRNLG